MIRLRSTATYLLVLGVLPAGSTVRAQPGVKAGPTSSPDMGRIENSRPPIETRAVLKPGAVLKVDDRVVDTGNTPRIYFVEQTRGEWLWITSGAIGGWVRAMDSISLSRAISETVLALVNRANARMAEGDTERAVADYDEAIRLDPDSRLAHMNRGIARQARGSIDDAIADYTEAIRLGMNTAQVYNNRGHAWEKKADFEKAIADFTRAIRLKPGYLISWLNRGNAWKAKGDWDKALADYEAAMRLDPRSPWPYALQAAIFAAPSRPKYRDGKRAVELANKATTLGGAKDAFLCGVCADAHEAAGQPDRAAQWRQAQQAASRSTAGARPVTRPVTTAAPSSIAYLSAIPADYVGEVHLTPSPDRWRGAPWQGQVYQPQSAESASERIQRDSQALDNLLTQMRRRQDLEFQRQQQELQQRNR